MAKTYENLEAWKEAGESYEELKEKVERLGRLMGGLLRFLNEKE